MVFHGVVAYSGTSLGHVLFKRNLWLKLRVYVGRESNLAGLFSSAPKVLSRNFFSEQVQFHSQSLPLHLPGWGETLMPQMQLLLVNKPESGFIYVLMTVSQSSCILAYDLADTFWIVENGNCSSENIYLLFLTQNVKDR